MSNMTFGVNILPTNGSSLNLGNSGQKWDIYANTINGVSAEDFASPVTVYTATIPTTGWTNAANGLKTVTVSISGLTTADVGIIGVVQSGTESTDVEIRNAFALITRVTTMLNSIIVYATAVPEVAIPIQIGVFK